MTAGELKDFLKEVPEDAKVILVDPDTYYHLDIEVLYVGEDNEVSIHSDYTKRIK